MDDDVDQSGLEPQIPKVVSWGAVAASVAFFAAGITSCNHNNSVEEVRAHDAMMAAGKACAVSSDRPAFAEQFRQVCANAADSQIYSLQSYFDETYFWSKTANGNRIYADEMAHIANDLPKIAKAEYDRREPWEIVKERMQNAVRDVVVDGHKPFAHAAADVVLQSLIYVTDAQGNDTRRVTGKFLIVITDPNAGKADGSRTYLYDHADKKIEETNGEIRTKFSFDGSTSFWSGGHLFSGQGEERGETTGEVKCSEHQTPCAVMAKLHETLNEFSPVQIAYLQAKIKALADYNDGVGQYRQPDRPITMDTMVNGPMILQF